MRRATFLSMLVSWVVPLCTALAADGPAKTPFELVRELQIVQDRAVLKEKGAQAGERKKIAKIGEWLSRYAPKVWEDPKNARAVVIYVLSGGDPRVLRKLLGSGVSLGIDDRLVKAALAYGERRDEKATELFEEINMDSIDESIVGHVALVRAVLIEDEDPPKALALLDMARIMASGTIVEEAALRREAILAAKAGKLDAFEAFSSQYFRRFASSRFAQSFGHQFAREVVTGRYAGDDRRLSKLDNMLRGLDEAERREACLFIAEEGVAVANVEMVRFAARTASPLLKDEAVDAPRMRLYEAAALVVTKDADKGLAALRSIDRAKLGTRDLDLLDAALGVAREVTRPPVLPKKADVKPSMGSEKKADSGPSGEIGSQQIARAEKAIARIDKMLSEAGR